MRTDPLLSLRAGRSRFSATLSLVCEAKWNEVTITARRTVTWMTMWRWRRIVATRRGRFNNSFIQRTFSVCIFSFLCLFRAATYSFNSVYCFSLIDTHGSMSPTTTTQVQARKRRRGVRQSSLSSYPVSRFHLLLLVFYSVHVVFRIRLHVPSVWQIIEKRRRDRINNSLSELRRLVPSAFEKQVNCTYISSQISRYCSMSSFFDDPSNFFFCHRGQPNWKKQKFYKWL